MRPPFSQIVRIALAVSLLGTTGAHCHPSIAEGICLGILPGPASALEERAILRQDWRQMVTEAFGAWIDPVSVRAPDSSPADLAITAKEASDSLRSLVWMVMRRLGFAAVTSVEGILFLVRSPGVLSYINRSVRGPGYLSYACGLEAIQRLLQILPLPPGAPDPMQAVSLYYSRLSDVVAHRGAQDPAPLPVCGLAGANLERNVEALRALTQDKGVCFAIASLDCVSHMRRGLLADLTVSRRIVTVVGQDRLEDAGQDTFRMRLTSDGWLIYQ